MERAFGAREGMERAFGARSGAELPGAEVMRLDRQGRASNARGSLDGLL